MWRQSFKENASKISSAVNPVFKDLVDLGTPMNNKFRFVKGGCRWFWANQRLGLNMFSFGYFGGFPGAGSLHCLIYLEPTIRLLLFCGKVLTMSQLMWFEELSNKDRLNPHLNVYISRIFTMCMIFAIRNRSNPLIKRCNSYQDADQTYGQVCADTGNAEERNLSDWVVEQLAT
nr:hypothetical protein HmN_000339200 [Hymenolepis microstoma]